MGCSYQVNPLDVSPQLYGVSIKQMFVARVISTGKGRTSRREGRFSDVPIIMLTERDKEANIVRGLNAGLMITLSNRWTL